MPLPTTQQELTQDAVRRDYKPGALVILLTGAVVQLTSWPWFDGEGDEQTAKVMARREVGDPTTNHEMAYMPIMRHLGQHVPLDEYQFAPPHSGANWTVVGQDEATVTLKDLGPWDAHPTITNDAEDVVQAMLPMLNGRKLYYLDSNGERDELIIRDGKFYCFAPAPRDEVFVLRSPGGGEEWRVSYRGGLIAATWEQRGPADAHLGLLKTGKAKAQYARGAEPPPLFNKVGGT